MTRWARGNNIHKHKAADATPWSKLRAGLKGRMTEVLTVESSRGASSGSLFCKDVSHKLRNTPAFPGRKRANKNKDVNGFNDYLKQTGQPLLRQSQRTARGEDDVEEELFTALEKEKKREHRRIKRQNTKKNNMVCFNCRKPGHGLADCPEADNDEEMGREVCYRCGSAEHDIQKCRAKVDPALGAYPFAKCFVCGITGHISRSCPDNPKGLYAAGGCCRVCGSVEHFQKDCPEHQTSTNCITLGRLSNQTSADHEDISVPVKELSAKKAKVVVF